MSTTCPGCDAKEKEKAEAQAALTRVETERAQAITKLAEAQKTLDDARNQPAPVTAETLKALGEHKCTSPDCGIKKWWNEHDAAIIKAAIANGDLVPKPREPLKIVIGGQHAGK